MWLSHCIQNPLRQLCHGSHGNVPRPSPSIPIHYKNRRIILTQLKASQLQLSIKLYGHRSPVPCTHAPPMWPGCLYSVDWTRDWRVGLDWGTGLTESCAHPVISKQHTHHTTVYLHHMNWIQGRRPSLDINIDRTRRSFNSHFFRCVCYKNMCTCKPNIEISTGHYPTAVLSVNMHSRTLILSSKQSLPSGKSPHVRLR